MRAEAKPMVPAVRESAATTLPRGGGLAALIAGSKFGVRTRLSSRSLGVKIVGASPHNIAAMNRGRLRHPVYGHDVWVTQQVEPGWFDKPLQKRAPAVRSGIKKALDDTGRRLTIRGM
jgi:hypothetical protein